MSEQPADSGEGAAGGISAQVFWLSAPTSRGGRNAAARERFEVVVAVIDPPPPPLAFLVARIVEERGPNDDRTLEAAALPSAGTALALRLPPPLIPSSRLRLDLAIVPERGAVREIGPFWRVASAPAGGRRRTLFLDLVGRSVTARFAGGFNHNTLLAYEASEAPAREIGQAETLRDKNQRRWRLELIRTVEPAQAWWLGQHRQRFETTQLQAAHASDAVGRDLELRVRPAEPGGSAHAATVDLSVTRVPRSALFPPRRPLPEWFAPLRSPPLPHAPPAEKLSDAAGGFRFRLKDAKPRDLILLDAEDDAAEFERPDGVPAKATDPLEITESLSLRAADAAASKALLDNTRLQAFRADAAEHRVARRIRALAESAIEVVGDKGGSLAEGVARLADSARGVDEFVLCLMRLLDLVRTAPAASAAALVELLAPRISDGVPASQRILSPLAAFAAADGDLRERLQSRGGAIDRGNWAFGEPFRVAFELAFPDSGAAPRGTSTWRAAAIIDARDDHAARDHATAAALILAQRGAGRLAQDCIRLSIAPSLDDAANAAFESELAELQEAFGAAGEAAGLIADVLVWANQDMRAAKSRPDARADVLDEIARRLKRQAPAGLLTMQTLRAWAADIRLSALIESSKTLADELRRNPASEPQVAPRFDETTELPPQETATEAPLSHDLLRLRAKGLDLFYERLVGRAASESWPRAVRRALVAVIDKAQAFRRWSDRLQTELRQWSESVRSDISETLDHQMQIEPEGVADSLAAAQALLDATAEDSAPGPADEERSTVETAARARDILAAEQRKLRRRTETMRRLITDRRKLITDAPPAGGATAAVDRLATHWAAQETTKSAKKRIDAVRRRMIEAGDSVSRLQSVSPNDRDAIIRRRDDITTRLARLTSPPPKEMARESAAIATAVAEALDLIEAARQLTRAPPQ